jgi:hypothetical protein
MNRDDDCALDLQTGLDILGLPPDMPHAEPILARGGTVLVACPACERVGRLHTLEVRMVDRRFIVTPVS